MIGRLRIVEQRYKVGSSGGNGGHNLLLIEEWLARMKKHVGEGGSSSGGNGDSHCCHGKNRRRDRSNGLCDGNANTFDPGGDRD